MVVNNRFLPDIVVNLKYLLRQRRSHLHTAIEALELQNPTRSTVDGKLEQAPPVKNYRESLEKFATAKGKASVTRQKKQSDPERFIAKEVPCQTNWLGFWTWKWRN